MSLNNRISISDLAAMKKRGEKWAMLTAYEQMTAEIFDEAQIPVSWLAIRQAIISSGMKTQFR
jgi:ketopantoate hydroxymethyltransferase